MRIKKNRTGCKQNKRPENNTKKDEQGLVNAYSILFPCTTSFACFSLQKDRQFTIVTCRNRQIHSFFCFHMNTNTQKINIWNHKHVLQTITNIPGCHHKNLISKINTFLKSNISCKRGLNVAIINSKIIFRHLSQLFQL